jgi:hypothetical protein
MTRRSRTRSKTVRSSSRRSPKYKSARTVKSKRSQKTVRSRHSSSYKLAHRRGSRTSRKPRFGRFRATSFLDVLPSMLDYLNTTYPMYLNEQVAKEFFGIGSRNKLIIHCHMLTCLALVNESHTQMIAVEGHEHNAHDVKYEEESEHKEIHEHSAELSNDTSLIQQLCSLSDGYYTDDSRPAILLLKFGPLRRERCIKVIVAQQWLWWHRVRSLVKSKWWYSMSEQEEVDTRLTAIPTTERLTNRNQLPVTWQDRRKILWEMPFEKDVYHKFMTRVYVPLFGSNTYIHWDQIPDVYKRLHFTEGIEELSYPDGNNVQQVYQFVSEAEDVQNIQEMINMETLFEGDVELKNDVTNIVGSGTM